MVDVATLAKRAHDTGFEKGSLATINLVLAYLDKSGPVSAPALLAAWNAGEVAGVADKPEPPLKAPAEPPPAILLTPPKITREQARGSGYTGDACTSCMSMQVKRNGSCLVCEACGTTTGCS